MTLLSITPMRAQFRPGEQLKFLVEADGVPAQTLALCGRITACAPARVNRHEFKVMVNIGSNGIGSAEFAIDAPPGAGGTVKGFAITIEDPVACTSASTAADIAPHWSSAPRYGFFADFGSDESSEESARRADLLLALHLNVIQFYDWMYTHHTLMPPTVEFTDPLGRRLSLDVVQRKLDLVHQRGMAGLAYGALYGAEADFADLHPDWLLYDGRHVALRLAEIFYLQDIRDVCGWRRWIIDQYIKVIDDGGFDGIHIDQYGYPKRSLSRATGEWDEVQLTTEFPSFVEQAAGETLAVAPEGGSIFNLVNGWPLEEMSPVTKDAATYIEVWEPYSTYRDLYDLIRRARELRPTKQVILAAYLRAFHPVDGRQDGAMTSFRLAWAAINASGGFQLVAGEGRGLLTEAYYPSYGVLSEEDFAVVRRYADFAVRNTSALHGGATDVAWTQVGPTNDVLLLDHPDIARDSPIGYSAGAVPGTVWTVVREYGDVTMLSLINLMGIESGEWNTAHRSEPTAVEGIKVRVVVTGAVTGVWWDTPDDNVGMPRQLDFQVIEDERNRFVEFVLPRLDLWSLVWWERAQ